MATSSTSSSAPQGGDEGLCVGRKNISTRLMITTMVLENFKSYAGEQEIGPFHKRFSSIVGPNGSGKSNVIDALLFVFGKRAKQLRLNKVSELIHKSSNFPNLEYAKVEVHFQLIEDDEDSEDDYEVVPGSEFIVSRTAFKDSTSKYKVDGKNSTYTEVGQLLRKHAIDLDNNRFLILQGEVEQIAMMKPKGLTPHEDGLLEYLEDIIGSNRYVEKIEESSVVVSQLNESRLERVKRLQIAQTDRENLEGPRAEAHAYLEKEADIRVKNNILYQYYIREASVNVDELNVKLSGYKEKLAYEKNKLKETIARLTVIEKEYDSSNKHYEQLMKEMQKTVDDFTAFERRDTKLIEDMKFLKGQTQKLNATIQKESKKKEECLAEVEALEKAITDMTADIVGIKARKDEAENNLEKIMDTLQESTASLREDLEGVAEKLSECDRAVSGFQTEKESIQTSIELIQERSQNINKSLAAAETKITALDEEERNLNANRETVVKRQSKLQADIANLQETDKKLTSHQTSLQNEVRTAVSQSEDAKAAFHAQQQQASSGAACRAEVLSIMRETRKGKSLAGIGVHGRLGDLGTIPEEFDIAVSTACGVLDFIVVDTGEAANACISYLRENNKGRASFIVLDQINKTVSSAKMNANLAVPAGTTRLFDHIVAKNDIFRVAFYMGLKDTLVTNDWDLAARIAYEGNRVKWRVVTTTGNLIDNSGAMSGGGKPSAGGKMLSSGQKAATQTDSSQPTITQKRIDELEAAVGAIQGKLAKCRSDIDANDKLLKSYVKDAKKIDIEIEKIDMSVSRVQSQRETIFDRVKVLIAEQTLTPEEEQSLQEMSQRLQSVDREIQKLAPNRQDLKKEAESIQKAILDVGGPKLKRAQSKVDEISNQLDGVQKSLTAKEVALSTSKKQAKKASTAKDKADKDLAEANEKMAAFEEEQKQMEAEAEQVLVAQEEAKQAATVKEEELKAISSEFEALKGDVATIQGVEVDLKNNVDNCSKKLKDNETIRNQWMQKLSSIRRNHDEDMKEHRAYLEGSTKNLSEGSEETKGEQDEKDSAEISSILKPLLEYDSEKLMEVVCMMAKRQTKSKKNEKPKRRRRIKTESDDEDEEEDEEEDEGNTEAGDKTKAGLGIEELTRDINLSEAERDRLKETVNLTSLMEYKKKDEEFRTRLAEVEEITAERNAARKDYEELRRKRLEEFMSGFGIITLKLKEMYQMITLGGDAELELVDSLDPFSEGIVFSVRPPKKSWKNISNLSGGEKTLSSLALVFALHHFKPTPLYVMDEIDAALDFKNVSIVANYIKDRTKNAQFVIISLRNNMFELANRLVGIYKTNDATKSVTINPASFSASVSGASASAPKRITADGGKQATDSSQESKAKPTVAVLNDSTNQL